jgi:hypothetical protein
MDLFVEERNLSPHLSAWVYNSEIVTTKYTDRRFLYVKPAGKG